MSFFTFLSFIHSFIQNKLSNETVVSSVFVVELLGSGSSLFARGGYTILFNVASSWTCLEASLLVRLSLTAKA